MLILVTDQLCVVNWNAVHSRCCDDGCIDGAACSDACFSALSVSVG